DIRRDRRIVERIDVHRESLDVEEAARVLDFDGNRVRVVGFVIDQPVVRDRHHAGRRIDLEAAARVVDQAVRQYVAGGRVVRIGDIRGRIEGPYRGRLTDVFIDGVGLHRGAEDRRLVDELARREGYAIECEVLDSLATSDYDCVGSVASRNRIDD